MHRHRLSFALLASIFIACAALNAPAWAQAQVPSFANVIGHEQGERITQHHEMARYLRRLAEASPRVQVREQGASWEGRELLLAIVTAPENQGRLDEIQRVAARLADPRSTSPEEAARLIEGQPIILWYGGSIHGFELSGSEGLLKLIEHLTTRDDEETRRILQNAVLLIDPMINPDGRDAFAQENHERIGRLPNPRRADWNNDYASFEALKFRTGHYFFDTNRDWFAQTQPETRARAATMQAWHPQVVVDLHEMSPDVEFFFDPPATPFGAFAPEYAREGYVDFGEAYAAAFDTAGFEYMTRERYNYLYPGYTGSYGSMQGAIGMLYEQGSSRGLAITRADESVRTLEDAFRQQYTAAYTAARYAAEERERLLEAYYAAHRAAIEEGRQGTRRYVITEEGDPNLVAELVNMLLRNGIEVGRLTEAATRSGVESLTGEKERERTFRAGSYVVEAAQPRNRLVRTLLEPETPIEEDFLEEARERIDRGENPRFYDITAWSLPLLFNVDVYAVTDSAALPMQPVTQPVRARVMAPTGDAAYAYLIPGDRATSMAALYHLKAEGHRAAVLTRPTRIEGEDFASGTVVVRVGQNDSTLHAAIDSLAWRFNLDIQPVSTGLSAEGFPALGSGDASFPVKKPRVALVADDPVQAYSFGWAWHALDRQYEIPTTVLRTGSLGEADLGAFNVLVLPSVYDSTAFKEKLGEEGMDRLKGWVRNGGTLVAIGGAVEVARGPLGLIDLRSWYDEEKEESEEDGEEAVEPQRFDVPGALFRARLDSTRWLASGYEGADLPFLVFSDRIYLPPEGPPSARRRVVAEVAETEPVWLAGHAWEESMERLPGAVLVYEERVGDGRVVAFAEDPNFRGYWRGADRLFLNAVVLGPSAP